MASDPEITVRPRTDGDTPVPVSSLTPVSAIPMTPGQLPSVPRRQRVIPAPFRRNRIDISHHGREWLVVPARTLRKDDLVVDRGKIVDTQWLIEYDTIEGPGMPVQAPVAEWLRVSFLSGEVYQYFPHEGVRAFVEVHENAEHESGALGETPGED